MAGLQELLGRAGIATKLRGTNVGAEHVNIHCPFCHEVKFHCGIHEADGWWKCWVCDEKGQWGKMARRLRQDYPSVPWQEFKPGKSTRYVDDIAGDLPRELIDLTRQFFSYDLNRIDDRDLWHWDYLLNERELEPQLITQLRPGVGLRPSGGQNLNGYVTFRDGQHLIARAMGTQTPRWWKSGRGFSVWGLDQMQAARPSWAIVCEGVFDALAVPLGHGLAILGSVASGINWAEAIAERAPAELQQVCIVMDPGVRKKTIYTMKLTLADLGFEVSVFDWDRVPDDEEEGFDLDRLRVNKGRDHVLEQVLHSMGVIDADDDEPLV